MHEECEDLRSPCHLVTLAELALRVEQAEARIAVLEAKASKIGPNDLIGPGLIPKPPYPEFTEAEMEQIAQSVREAMAKQ